MERLGQDDIEHSQRRVVCISQDAFYRPLNAEESAKALKVSFKSIYRIVLYVLEISACEFDKDSL